MHVECVCIRLFDLFERDSLNDTLCVSVFFPVMPIVTLYVISDIGLNRDFFSGSKKCSDGFYYFLYVVVQIGAVLLSISVSSIPDYLLSDHQRRWFEYGNCLNFVLNFMFAILSKWGTESAF